MLQVWEVVAVGGGGEVELSSSMSCVHCGTDGEPKERATSVGGGGGGGGGGEVELSSSMSCVHCGTDGEPKERATFFGCGRENDAWPRSLDAPCLALCDNPARESVTSPHLTAG